jgi:hypothetical protein
MQAAPRSISHRRAWNCDLGPRRSTSHRGTLAGRGVHAALERDPGARPPAGTPLAERGGDLEAAVAFERALEPDQQPAALHEQDVLCQAQLVLDDLAARCAIEEEVLRALDPGGGLAADGELLESGGLGGELLEEVGRSRVRSAYRSGPR